MVQPLYIMTTLITLSRHIHMSIQNTHNLTQRKSLNILSKYLIRSFSYKPLNLFTNKKRKKTQTV